MERILRTWLLHNEKLCGLQQPLVWPVLVGYTGAGKTTLVERLGAEMKAQVVRLAVPFIPEHELLGIPFPKETPRGLVTVQSLPDWAAMAADNAAMGKRTIIFLDELDKVVQEERRNALLTLLAERRLHNLVLPKEVSFVGAMQPARGSFWAGQTGEALLGRVGLLPLSERAAWQAIAAKHSSFGGLLEDIPTRDIPLPKREHPVTRIMDWVLGILPQFTQEEQETILPGLLPDAWVVRVVDACAANVTLDIHEIVAALAEDPTRVDNLSGPELQRIFSEGWTSHEMTAPLVTALLRQVLIRLTPEELVEATDGWLKNIHEFLVENTRDGEVEFLPKVTAEEYIEAFSKGLSQGGSARYRQITDR